MLSHVPPKKEELGREQGAREDEDCGGNDPAGPAGVEGPKVESAVPFVLGNEEPCDQEAREDEEDVDADEACPCAGDPDVAQEHEQDGDPAQALEVRAKRWSPGVQALGAPLDRVRLGLVTVAIGLWDAWEARL